MHFNVFEVHWTQLIIQIFYIEMGKRIKLEDKFIIIISRNNRKTNNNVIILTNY
jgi:hypothetical protein